MATNIRVPVSEYLSTMHHHDGDYVDGEIQERNWAELDHSNLRVQLTNLLCGPSNEPYVRVNLELRVQTGTAQYRVPDVCVRRAPAPREQIVVTPPLLCIEILSPED